MASSSTPSMRFLVACAECKRQYDATRLKAGSRFHCMCGETVVVPRAESHESSVVRCSSCGAPRDGGGKSCRHCGAGFTLQERDMHTICPQCMTRVSDAARYCHHCATPLVPQGDAGTRTDYPCPACGHDERLNGRRFGDPPMSVLECPCCAGLWLGSNTFEELLNRARAAEALEALPAEAPQTQGAAAQQGPLYRNCPDCACLMNRRNFARRSGVILDICKEHGIWFDAEELDRILRWIRSGGEVRAKRSEANEQRMQESQSRFKASLKTTQWQQQPTPYSVSDETLPAMLGRFLGSLLGD